MPTEKPDGETLGAEASEANSVEEDQEFTAAALQNLVRGEMTWGQLQDLTMGQAYALFEAGKAQFLLGNYEAARSVFEGLIVSNPYDASFHIMLGRLYAETNRAPEAVEEFSIAMELDSNNIDARVNRAELLLQHGEFELAATDLRDAIDLGQSQLNPIAARARVLASATEAIVDTLLVKNSNTDSVG